MNKEIWKDIVGYEGLYQVSNTGKVKSLRRYVSNGSVGIRCVKEKILSNCKIWNGYLLTGLNKNRVKKRFSIHRLVMMSFCPIPNPEEMQVNHKDLNKANNHIDNLEWCTQLENMKHAVENGVKFGWSPGGELHGTAKLTNIQAEEIRKVYKRQYGNQKKLAKIYNVKPYIIGYIVRGQTYKNEKIREE